MSKLHGPRVYGAVTVGEKGQVVIPVQVRKMYNITTGDRLIVIAKPHAPIGFIPADQLNEFLSNMTEMLARIKKEKPNAK